MSATMARQGGHVQLEQSDMHLALHMAKMAKGEFLSAAKEETEYLINKPRTEVWAEKKQGVEFPGHKKVKAGTERHPAMLRQNHTPGCLSCLIGTAHNPLTCWGRKGTGASTPNRHRHQTSEPTPEPTPPLPGAPSASTGDTSGARRLEIINSPAGYAHSHTSLRCAKSITLDTSAQDSEHDTDWDPDMLPDKGTSTG